jgi:hypothetical protein
MNPMPPLAIVCSDSVDSSNPDMFKSMWIPLVTQNFDSRDNNLR